MKFSVPIYIRRLNGLAGLPEEGAGAVRGEEVRRGDSPNYRLYPDMFSFARQVSRRPITRATARRFSRGVEAPKVENTRKACPNWSPGR
jgi:hypothetical protein